MGSSGVTAGSSAAGAAADEEDAPCGGPGDGAFEGRDVIVVRGCSRTGERERERCEALLLSSS